MTADELKLFINNFKMKSDNDQNVDVLIDYFGYYSDEKELLACVCNNFKNLFLLNARNKFFK